MLLERQEYRCAAPHCRADILRAFHCDHITPLSRGGSNLPENIQILCPACNMAKGARTMEEMGSRPLSACQHRRRVGDQAAPDRIEPMRAGSRDVAYQDENGRWLVCCIRGCEGAPIHGGMCVNHHRRNVLYGWPVAQKVALWRNITVMAHMRCFQNRPLVR
jgi:hypothetical protein